MSQLRDRVRPAEESEWDSWSVVFLAYLGAVDEKMGVEICQAIQRSEKIKLAGMVDGEKSRAASLYGMLIQVLQKTALMTFKITETQNGYDVMRKLADKSRWAMPGSSLTPLQAILSFDISGGDMQDHLEHFDHIVTKYEGMKGSVLDNDITVSVLLKAIADVWKTSVFSKPADFDTDENVRRILDNLLTGRKIHNPNPNAIEVDALGKGKGKGNKGKGWAYVVRVHELCCDIRVCDRLNKLASGIHVPFRDPFESHKLD